MIMRFRLTTTAGVCLLFMGLSWPASDVAAAPTKRLLVFLGRDAQVKESAETSPLVGGGPTTIVAGRDALAGPRESFENSQIATAAKVLANYLEKITGATFPVVGAGAAESITDGGFEEPPAAASPNPAWPALAGRWYSYLNRSGKAAARVADERAHGGNAAVVVEGAVPPGGLAGAMRPLALAEGEKHRITFWYRTTLPGKGNAVVVVPKMEPPVDVALPPSQEWKRAEVPFVASQAEASVILGLKGSDADTSQVWFDDVAVEKVPETAAATAGARRIFVGSTGKATEEFPELAKADDHGFVIARKGSDLHIVGKCGTATLYGVWFFLYNHAGLRIVMPGEIGEVYEKQPALAIPKDLYVFNPGPDFLLRIISQPAFDRLSWLQDATGTERFLYHHAFARVLPAEKFGQSRPELYPILGGKRFIPPVPTKAGSWQPTFSEPKLVDHVLEHADQAFTQNPTLQSISVMPNDGDGYSELDTKDGGGKDKLDGWRRHYYTFVNTVAKAMAGKWPGRYLAFLSYRALETPPDFKLADNVMLFLFSKTGNIQETMAQWKDKVSNVGVYQWLYGNGWLYPCHGPKTIQDYLRYLHGLGGRAFKGEAYIGFAKDGARMWVTSNLLWNVDADADALLMDYLDACYGTKAAAAMRKYHARVEEIGERRRTPTQFNLTRYRVGTYQFEHVTEEDFRVMDAAFEEAARVVEGEANRTRLEYTRKCHEFCRLYWTALNSLKRCEDLFAKGVSDEATTRAALAQSAVFTKAVGAIPGFEAANLAPLPQPIAKAGDGHEYWLGAGFAWRDKHDVIAKALDAITAARLKTDTVANVDAFWKVAGQREPELELFTNQQRWSVLPKDTPLKNLLSNGGFEEPAATDDAGQKNLLEKFRKWEYKFSDFNDLRYNDTPCRDWVSFDRRGIEFQARRVEDVHREGRASMLLSGASFKGGVLHHFVPPESRGRYRLSLWYKTEGAIGAGICGLAYSECWGFEYQYRVITGAADWRRLEFEFTANSPPAQAPCVLGIHLQDSKPDAKLWLDDVRIELLSPAGVAEGK